MEEWKDKILSSLEGIERAKPPVDSFHQIQQKITLEEQSNTSDSSSIIIKIAATIALFVFMDILIINAFNEPVSQSTESKTYSGLVSNYNIYE